MKKLIFTLLTAFLFLLNVTAQSTNNYLLERTKEPRTAGKTTATQSRLISYAKFTKAKDSAMQLFDTAYAIYTGDKGWDPVVKDWKWDTLRYSVSAFGWEYKQYHSFDAQGRIKRWEMVELDNGSYVPFLDISYTYDAQGKIATSEETRNIGSTTTEKAFYTYDAQGRIVETTVQRADSYYPYLRNYSRTVSNYNSLGQVDTTTDYFWDLTIAEWLIAYRTISTYSGTASSISIRSQFDGTSWQDDDTTINTYDSQGNILERQSNNWYDSSWHPSKFTYTYDTAGNQSSVTGFTGTAGTYEPHWQESYTYNSFGQLLETIIKSWDSPSAAFFVSWVYHYHYEQFETNNVPETTKPVSSMQVYPMPARNTMILDLKWNETQTATILLFDMTGKLAGQWATPTVKQTTQTLDISNIPSGTYMLKVMGSKGVMSRQVNIVK